MRGEHSGLAKAPPTPSGSSPHARGTHAAFEKAIAATGIIPACAGNTSTCTSRGVMRGDHPRMRGEHYGDSDFVDELEGSSPHARGTHAAFEKAIAATGIIPACAGNTVPSYAGRSCSGDHPRMRGEHVTLQPRYVAKRGSSPHARGTLCGCFRACRVGGIIPACAGNTRRAYKKLTRRRDHPRMRGEHCIIPRVIGSL